MGTLSLNQVSLQLAQHQLLDQVSLQIHAGERIALVGRNGAGKSSLLNLLSGGLQADRGEIQQSSAYKIASLMQDVPVCSDAQPIYVYEGLVGSLGPLSTILSGYWQSMRSQDSIAMTAYQQQIDSKNAWHYLPRIEAMAQQLGLDMQMSMHQLSGGLLRRVLLAAALLADADLLLLDEPTNHLDIMTIEWLEQYLLQYRGSVIIVTHDRAFLSNIATRIIELDRGKLFSHTCNYATYLDRREAIRLMDQRAHALFTKELQAEEVWLRQGVKARRTRNEGRVRRLKAMREQQNNYRQATGLVNTTALNCPQSGQIVLEANHLNYTLNNLVLLQDFSLVLMRGDKIGIIGANGCGKTTLVRLLLNEIHADSGVVKLGTGLQIAYFDQLRHQLDVKQTVLYNVAYGADYVTINGKQKHVASYLKDFLFLPEQFNQPVFSLSGGERNRLLLARLFAQPINCLVLDEPTNDLDVETLELLESLLIDYTGTLLLISHDREFINQVVTKVIVHTAPGTFVAFPGNYAEYREHTLKQQKLQLATTTIPLDKPPAPKIARHSYQEQRELQQLVLEIERTEKAVAILHQSMSTSEFYTQNPEVIQAQQIQLATDTQRLEDLLVRWELLEAR